MRALNIRLLAVDAGLGTAPCDCQKNHQKLPDASLTQLSQMMSRGNSLTLILYRILLLDHMASVFLECSSTFNSLMASSWLMTRFMYRKQKARYLAAKSMCVCH